MKLYHYLSIYQLIQTLMTKLVIYIWYNKRITWTRYLMNTSVKILSKISVHWIQCKPFSVELKLNYTGLSWHLGCQQPISAGSSSQLLHFQLGSLLMHPGKQQKIPKFLGPHLPHGKPRWTSRFLASVWLRPGHCCQLGSGTVDGRSLSL